MDLYVACPKQGILTNSKWEDKISLLIKKYYFSLTVALKHKFDARLNVDKKVVFQASKLENGFLVIFHLCELYKVL